MCDQFILPGTLVICVDDRFPPQVWEWCNEVPRRGDLYTVKQICGTLHGVTNAFGIGLVLNELNNPGKHGGQVSFDIKRFRSFEGELLALSEPDEERPNDE